MCGIAGIFDLRERPAGNDPAARARLMVDTLIHRGPDGGDCWGDPDSGIGLGHRRLAIVDLQPTGAQPMHSADGRYVITYNGEVYNFRELRAELEALGHRFRGTSDTEVMLAAIGQWGLRNAIDRFVGMFAFAVFDRRDRTLSLVRDRLGVKPLYWCVTDGLLLFGSELRALMAHDAFRRQIDPEALDALLRYSYIPAPATIFRGTFKLPPGSILTCRAGGEPEIKSYWSIASVAEMPESGPGNLEEAVEATDAAIRLAVSQRMFADVPIGAFLSGGIDSAAVVAHMQAGSSRPVRTFTIGFEDAAYDETQSARAVARHLGTDHTEVMLQESAVLDLVDRVADWFDEPFADSSQLPSYLVSQMTRRHVTVALSGDGGDELFGGYPKYRWLTRIWNGAGRVPLPLRAAVGRALIACPEAPLRMMAARLLDAGRAERIGEKARRLGWALGAKDGDQAAASLAMVGISAPGLVRGAHGTLDSGPPPGFARNRADLLSRMQLADTAGYLPDDILTKVDRCSMAVSLEAREPLLDHRLVERVWSLPACIRHAEGRPKSLLRAVLARHLPAHLIDRPKRGFSIPLAQWLRGPLRGWASELLAAEAATRQGLFDAAAVDALWRRHCDGTQDNATGLWNILMVCAWRRRWMN